MFGLLLSDLAISRGEEEIEKSDCRLTFMQTLPRRVFRFPQTKPDHLLMRVLCSGPQSSVNLRTSNIYMCFIHSLYVDLCSFHIKYRTSMSNRLLCCIHSLNGH